MYKLWSAGEGYIEEEDKVITVEIERDILIYAFRYALGRMSYAPSSVVDNIKRNIDKVADNDIELFIREIGEAHETDRLGMECDELTWMRFKHYLEVEVGARK